MVEIALDWELVKWVVIYGCGIFAIYFAGVIIATRKIMAQIAMVLKEYSEAFQDVADALEDNAVSEQEFEKIFKSFQEGWGETDKLIKMIKEALPYQFLIKIFGVGK